MNHVLTKTDVRAMREADRVSFHVHDRKGWISCTKDRSMDETRGPFDPASIDHNLADVEYMIRAYGRSCSCMRVEASCFAWVSSAQIEETWRTIVASIKPGDVVSMEYIANNTSQEMRDNGHTSDYCNMVATRTTKAGKIKRLVWRIDTYYGPDTSARMVRNAHDYDYATV